MRLRELVVAVAIGALVIAGGAPAAAAGSDGPTPYAVTDAGIALPAGDTFPDGGHVNISTSAGNRSIQFESLNQSEDSPKRLYIGAGSIPWSAFGIDIATTCVTWVQISLYNEHYGEGGQPGVGACGEDSPPDDGSGDKKIEFCHATGSETNPYVKIETSLAAFYKAGHINDDEHHSGVDIYPAGTFTHPVKGVISWEAQGDQSLLAYEDCMKPVVVEPITPPAPVWVDTCEATGMWTYTDTDAYLYSEGDGMITVTPRGDTVFTDGATVSWPTPAEDEGLECDDGSGDKKIEFCHATGSETNPYVKIETSLAAFFQAGHINDDEHHSGVDIYPAGTFTHPVTGVISWEAQGDQSLLAYEDCMKPAAEVVITAPTWMDPCDADNAYWDAQDGVGYTWEMSAVLGGAITATAVPMPGYVFMDGAQTVWTDYDSGVLCDDGSGDKKIEFCHATGSETNPYVKIETSLAAFFQAGHINTDANHPGFDIFPAGSFTHPVQGVISWEAQGDQSLLAYEDCMVPVMPQIWACTYVPDQDTEGAFIGVEGQRPSLYGPEDLTGFPDDWMPGDRPWYLLDDHMGLAYVLAWDEGQDPPSADDCFRTAEVMVSDFSGEPPCEATEFTQTATQTRMVYSLEPLFDEGGIITILERLVSSEQLAPLTRTVTVEEPEPCPVTEPTMEVTVTSVCEDDVPYLDYEIMLTDPDGTVTATEATLTFTQGDESIDLTVPRDSGRITWPGYASEDGVATAWPGYELVDGLWVNVGLEKLGWTRDADVTLTVNPSATVAVTYPTGSGCAPVNPEVEVEPETTTPTTPTSAPAATPVAANVTYTG